MKKLLFAAVLLAPPLYAQTEGDYAHQLTDVAVRLDGGSVVAAGGAVTGGTCTNQVVTALDTSGVPTCANVSSAMIPATTILASDIQDGSAISIFGRSANSAGVMASIQCAAAGAGVIRESGSTLGCGTVATAGIADSAITLAKIANAATNRVVLGSGTAGSGAAYTEIGAGPGVTVSQAPAGGNKIGFDPRTQWFLYDEFLGVPATTTNPGGALAWTVSNQNTPGNLTKLTPVTATIGTDHPGVVVLTGNAGNNASQLIRLDAAAITVRGGEVGECMIYILAAATGNGDYGCGFGDSTSSLGAPTDGAVLYYNSVTSANWLVRNRAAAGGASSASNLAVTTGAWHRLTIYVESVSGAGAGIIHYYVDGTELNNSPKIADVPQGDNATGYNVGFVQSTGGGAVPLMYLDYVLLYGTLAR